MERLNNARILIYSHDSFGLGHLRRCRAIAHALVDRFKGVSVLILSGLADHRQLRLPAARRLRPHSRRDQASRRRVPVARPAHRPRPDDGDARRDHPPDRGELPAGPVPGRQGAARPQGRGRCDAADAEGAGGPRSCSACATSWTSPRLLLREWKRKRVLPGARAPVRRDLGLRTRALRRSAARASPARCRCAGRWSTPATCGARCRT